MVILYKQQVSMMPLSRNKILTLQMLTRAWSKALKILIGMYLRTAKFRSVKHHFELAREFSIILP